jgi:ABC-type sugar transport system substrate-binding protein
VSEPIIVVALTDESDEFQRQQAADARSAAEAQGLRLRLVSGGGYAIEQIHRLFRYVHAPEADRPAAIVVEAVSEDGMARLARNAVRAGIAWVSLSRSPWLGQLRSEHPGHPLASVSADQVEVGRLQGEQVRALLPEGGRLLCITGPSRHAAPGERRLGLELALAGSGIEVAYEEGNWTAESGARLLRGWTRLRTTDEPGFEVLACQNDDMAAGAREILAGAAGSRRESWARIPVLGVDGLPGRGIAMVDRGDLAATVITPPTSGAAVERLGRWLHAGEPIPPEVLLPPTAYPEPSRLSRRAFPSEAPVQRQAAFRFQKTALSS